jgi:hypothetical protein
VSARKKNDAGDAGSFTWPKATVVSVGLLCLTAIAVCMLLSTVKGDIQVKCGIGEWKELPDNLTWGMDYELRMLPDNANCDVSIAGEMPLWLALATELRT